MEMPGIRDLKQITKALATLDLILEPDWEYRTYSYNSRWADDLEMASMRNGSGDDWFMALHRSGWVGLKGFAHESAAASVSGFSEALQKAVPDSLGSFSQEAAFQWEDTTFCLWRLPGDAKWSFGQSFAKLDGAIETGQTELLSILGSGPEGYKAYAGAYFSKDVPLEAIAAVYGHRPLTDEMVKAINPENSLAHLGEALSEIGYPIQGG